MKNLANLNFTDAQLTAIDSAIQELERQLSGLVALTTADKRRSTKLGEKSEYFCRQTLRMMSENPQLIPPNLDLADAMADLNARDQLRPRLMRLTRLLERGEDTDFALGSDAMAAAMRGYSLLKAVSGREGLDQLRRDLGSRFSKTRRLAPEEKKAAHGRLLGLQQNGRREAAFLCPESGGRCAAATRPRRRERGIYGRIEWPRIRSAPGYPCHRRGDLSRPDETLWQTSRR